MEGEKISLDPDSKTQFAKLLQIIFGIFCIIASIYFLISGYHPGTSIVTLLVAAVFLLLFGIYQIMAGLGKTQKYFLVKHSGISFKEHSILHVKEIPSDKIEKIELYPLSIKFLLKDSKKIRFRFGISYPEIIDPVKQEVIGFAEDHSIPWNEVPEEI